MNGEEFLGWCQSFQPLSDTSLYRCKPLIMGVLNVTPDSFSDGGHFMNPELAGQHARKMINEGADLIDIGGESSKPGAVSISSDEECSRVIPIIERVRASSDICISIDTCKADVMQSAVDAGASLINDITALREQGSMMMAARLGVPVCLMHMLGTPSSMQDNPVYASNVVSDINYFFTQRIDACVQAGIARNHLLLDPGFGFGKSVHHNLTLTKHLDAFHRHQLPVLLGGSRKSTLGSVLQCPVDKRGIAGIAIAVFAAMRGVAMIRTHEVHETHQALKMLDAIEQGMSQK